MPKQMGPMGYKVVGTIKSIKGNCHAGHKVGDKIELSIRDTGGLCGSFYHDIFPYVVMLEFGGQFPFPGGDVILQDCMDRTNLVTIELRREE